MSNNNEDEQQHITGFLNAADAFSLDQELMTTPGFTLEQLMELAGLAVAEAVVESTDDNRNTSIWLVCGPGNNGGDGLVAARHLLHFGYENVHVVYPKRPFQKQPHYENLVRQCEDLHVPVLWELPNDWCNTTHPVVVVDAIFGFSFLGDPRPPFDAILHEIQREDIMTVSVDVPSGWSVDGIDGDDTRWMPNVLVSLTAPKLCAKYFTGRHFVGGRFLPPALAEKYNIRMPPYPGVRQVMEM